MSISSLTACCFKVYIILDIETVPHKVKKTHAENVAMGLIETCD